jgi:uncharacterized membrane protein YhaH (DUF805 family)
MQLKENILFHDRYRLLKLLGRGGFSEVWMAEDAKTGVIVALKVYAPGMGLDEDGRELFSREFSMVFNLNHSNLVRPSHYDVCERMPYLIMPYCERGSAKKLTGNISETEAWKFIYDVASGLAYLHAQASAVIHQDIKSDNILIDSNGCYQITDFGISSKVRSTLRKSVGKESSGGTLAYMSPERFGRDNIPIKSGDIWALGATLYELLTGDVPFGEHGGLIQKSGAEIPNLPGNYSTELKEIVYRCLSVDPWDRPTAEALVEWALQHKRGEKISFTQNKYHTKEAGEYSTSTNQIHGFGWYKKVWRQYVDFKGRAGRKEYWMFTLFNTLFILAFLLIAAVFGGFFGSDESFGGIIAVLLIPYFIAVLTPILALTVRRLHDAGLSGWWLLIGLIPYAGEITLFIFTLLNSNPNANKWGENPKEQPCLTPSIHNISRPPAVSVWLILMMIFYGCATIFFFFNTLRDGMLYSWNIFPCDVISSILFILSSVLLWKRLKAGFWILSSVSLLFFFYGIYHFNAHYYYYMEDYLLGERGFLTALGYVLTLVTWCFLQIKLYWYGLEKGFQWRKSKPFYLGTLAIALIVFIIYLSLPKYVAEEYEYEETTEATTVEEVVEEATPAIPEIKMKTVRASDGSCSVEVPENYIKMSGNPDEILFYGYTDYHPYVQIVNEPQSVFEPYGITDLSGYTDLILSMHEDDETMPYRLISRSNIRINGLNAVLLDGTKRVEGINARYKIVTVKGRRNFYQVVIFVDPDYYTSRMDIMDSIMNSFREL